MFKGPATGGSDRRRRKNLPRAQPLHSEYGPWGIWGRCLLLDFPFPDLLCCHTVVRFSRVRGSAARQHRAGLLLPSGIRSVARRARVTA